MAQVSFLLEQFEEPMEFGFRLVLELLVSLLEHLSLIEQFLAYTQVSSPPSFKQHH